MKKYYMRNRAGRIEEIWLTSDLEAFQYAIDRNKRKYEGWVAYDSRGERIVFVANYISGELFER